MAKKKSDQFEEALQKLQEIVDKLEKGDLPLEEAMNCFSDGMRLAHFCHQKLEEAENRVQVLLKDQEGGWSAAPFEASQAPNSGESE